VAGIKRGRCHCDTDGILFLSERNLPDVIATAEQIRDTERRQAGLMAKGQSLRKQCNFEEYLRKSKEHPSYGFREHLCTISGAIET
jgi:4-hydroxy-4-methyl-2-oxoglutarate aldolase